MTDQRTEPVAAVVPAASTARRGRGEELGLLLRTVGHLRPAQIGHRVRLRSQRLVDPWWFGRQQGVAVESPGWPAGFRALESGLDHGRPEEVAAGRFDLVGEERELGDPADWAQPGATHLWRFELHYFEWAWSLAAADDRAWAREAFARLWRSWMAGTRPGSGDAWSPYVVSLRAWVLCDVFEALVSGSEVESEVIAELGRHAGFVRSHLELDVGGNHLLKNLKALIGLGVFLGRSDLVDLGLRHLQRQLQIQVLADGGHFERSPSYHCQVLTDLMDLRVLLIATGVKTNAGLDSAIARMQAWLGAMLGPDGEVPLLNDAVPIGPARLAILVPGNPPKERLTILGASGYVVIRHHRAHLVLDVGDPCPDELPAHAHADCLSFLLWVDNRQVVVDTGTSTYEPGPRRDYERSTAAHNTVEIDGQNQTEVWGAFRAGRRARGTLEETTDDNDVITVVASHDGYRHLPGSPVHRRKWTVTPQGLDVSDTICGVGTHEVVSRLHITSTMRSPCTVDGHGAIDRSESETVGSGFARLRPSIVRSLLVRSAALPCSLGWSVTWT